MADFFGIKSGGLTTIGLYVSAAMVLVGGGLTIYHSGGGTSGDMLSGDFYYKCSHCQDTQKLSIEDVEALKEKQNEMLINELEETDPEAAEELRGRLDGSIQVMIPGSITPNWGTPGAEFLCGKCGENGVLSAMKCPKCGEIFITYDDQGQYSDKCTNPKCGYSQAEENRNKWKEEQQKKRDRKKKK